MRETSSQRWAFTAALILAALSLAPSYAHLLEAPPRLMKWTPALWREATVFNGQFALFARVGAPVEVACIVATAFAAWTVRRRRKVFLPALGACLLFALALLVWFAVVAPANAVLATWTPGPIPAGFDAVRTRWEGGHIAIACVKLVAFALLAIAAANVGRRRWRGLPEPRADLARIDRMGGAG